uniref:Uncharacterized protein n=1 Tax=Ananas comosus var. bracteatus TaxID=296719 RepID=A0A6V7QBU0_ANACO|nr:unnamed protein product [Ananas comosus var. bracteatus]
MGSVSCRYLVGTVWHDRYGPCRRALKTLTLGVIYVRKYPLISFASSLQYFESSKGSKGTMITSKILGTKRSMKCLLFHVETLLHNTSSSSTSWMGNLQNYSLEVVVSSQVYNTGDNDEAEDQMKADPKVCGDNNNQGGMLSTSTRHNLLG